MTRILLTLVIAIGLAFGSAPDLLAKGGSHGGSKGGSKGGHYSGGMGSSNKGGQYTPPFGRRYSK
jgi:hypothetical protein